MKKGEWGREGKEVPDVEAPTAAAFGDGSVRDVLHCISISIASLGTNNLVELVQQLSAIDPPV